MHSCVCGSWAETEVRVDLNCGIYRDASGDQRHVVVEINYESRGVCCGLQFVACILDPALQNLNKSCKVSTLKAFGSLRGTRYTYFSVHLRGAQPNLIYVTARSETCTAVVILMYLPIKCVRLV